MDERLDLVGRFTLLPDWSAQLLMLETFPLLRTPEALDAFDVLIGLWDDSQQDYRKQLIMLRDWVRYCMNEGVQKAYRFLHDEEFRHLSADVEPWFVLLRLHKDAGKLEQLAQWYPALSKHAVCALEIMLERNLIPESAREGRIGHLYRLARALLAYPVDSGRDALHDAAAYADQALVLLRADDAPDLRASVLAAKGFALWRLAREQGTDVGTARATIEQARSLLQIQPASITKTQINLLLGILCTESPACYDPQTVEQGISVLREGLQTARESSHEQLIAEISTALGTAYRRRQVGELQVNLTEAIRHLELARAIYEVRKDDIRKATVEIQLGSAYLDAEEMTGIPSVAKARACYEGALSLFPEELFPKERAEALHGLGACLIEDWLQGRSDSFAEGLARYQEAARIAGTFSDKTIYARVLQFMGIAYAHVPTARSENVLKAIDCFLKAERELPMHADRIVRAQILHNLAHAYLDLPSRDMAVNHQAAREQLLRALDYMNPRVSPRAYALIMRTLGRVYAQSVPGGSFHSMSQAIECFSEAAKYTDKETEAAAWASLTENAGVALSEWHDENRPAHLRESLARLQEAAAVYLRINQGQRYAHVLHNMGNVCAELAEATDKAYFSQARQHFMQALEYRQKGLWPVEHRQTCRALGDLCFRLGQWQEASRWYEQAVTISERLIISSPTAMGREGEVAEVGTLYRNYAYCLARLGRLTEAVECMEMSRTRTLREAVTREVQDLSTLKSEHRVRYRDLASRLAVLDASIHDWEKGEQNGPYERLAATVEQVAKLRNELASLTASVRAYAPSFLVDRVAMATIIQSASPSRPYVYLATTTRGSFTIIVTRDHASPDPLKHLLWLDAFTEETIRKDFYGWYGAPSPLAGALGQERGQLNKALTDFLALLGAKLMSPICQRLRGLGYGACKLVPLDALGLMPLHAASDSEGRYLAERTNISYCLSAQMASSRKTSRSSASRPSLLAICATRPSTAMEEAQITQLIFSPVEVRSIARLFEDSEILSETQATKAALQGSLESSPSHLHFSCHGVFDMYDARRSSLLLGNGEKLPLDGIGVFDLKGVQLVVLSACQTALSEFRNTPDEAIGFPAAFIQAGARGVIGTLWPVAEIASAILLRRFYYIHLKRNVDAPEALAQAQRWLREATASEMQLVQWYKLGYQGRSMPEAAVQTVRYYEAHPGERPFERPFFWAGFSYVGL